jgi:hypothetical protein
MRTFKNCNLFFRTMKLNIWKNMTDLENQDFLSFASLSCARTRRLPYSGYNKEIIVGRGAFLK